MAGPVQRVNAGAPQLRPKLLEKDWGKWQQAVKRAKGGPRVLIPTSVGAYSQGAAFESLLAVGLTLRGAEVHFLLCDQHLPACMHLLLESTADPAQFARNMAKVFERAAQIASRYAERSDIPNREAEAQVTPIDQVAKTLSAVAQAYAADPVEMTRRCAA